MSKDQSNQSVAENAFFDNKDIPRRQTPELRVAETDVSMIEGKRGQRELDSELLGSLLEEDEGHKKLVDLAISEGKDRFEELVAAAVDCGVSEEIKDQYFDLFSKTCQELQDSFARYETAVGQALQTADMAEPWSSEQSIAVSKANKLLSEQGALGALIPKAEQATARLEPVPDRDPEKGDVVQEFLGVDTEQLFEEKIKLEQSSHFYKSIVAEIIDNKEGKGLSDEELKTVFDRVISRLRSETDIMQAYDKEGIDIFAEDLRDQPNFPELDAIKFSTSPALLSKEKRQLLRKAKTPGDISTLIAEDGIVCDDMVDLKYHQQNMDKHAGGQYSHRDTNRRVYVLDEEPTLESRLNVFLKTGGVSGATSTLVHEIRHHVQDVSGVSSNSGDGISALKEAQSYVQHSLSNFSERMLAVFQTLSRKGGLYEVDPNNAIQAVEFVERLNAMGVGQTEIAQLITKVDCDPETGAYLNLDLLMKEKLKERNIGEADVDVLQDVSRVLRRVKQLRVQDMARQELFAAIGEERLQECAKSTKPELLPFSDVSGEEKDPALVVFGTDKNSLLKKVGYKIGLDVGGGLEVQSLQTEYNGEGKLTNTRLAPVGDSRQDTIPNELHSLLKSFDRYTAEDILGSVWNAARTEEQAGKGLLLAEKLRPFLADFTDPV